MLHNGVMPDDSVTAQFAPVRGYLNTASLGLPPRATGEALHAALDDWFHGRWDAGDFDVHVDTARAAYARVVDVDVARVGILSQVSTASGLVAASLPEGSRVLLAEEEFSSTIYPFLNDTRLDVQAVPLDSLLDRIDDRADLVVVSAVQSADGRVTDLDALEAAAKAHGVRTFVDLSQASGWLPVKADRFDVTACGAYKWLCSPRGSGFITVAEWADWVRPVYPNWYSGPDPWQSLYGTPVRLASDARRYNVSPAWFDFVGAAVSVSLLADLGVETAHRHSVRLANRLREALGMEPSNSAIVALDTPHGDRLREAGVKAAIRAGKVRLSFYIYNTDEDVDLVADLLGAAPA